MIKSYQQQVVEGIQRSIENLGPKTKLREACEYALMNGGKRLRPSLVLMIADALGHAADVMPAALSIEYFHTASLVADDLPCMDDDDERRHQPSVHKKYGETIAMLASYALIAEGYGFLAKNAQLIQTAGYPFSVESDKLCVMVLENATFNTGLMGATGGQFMDIFPPELTVATVREVIHKKTVSLFEIAFVSGWLFGGGNPRLLPIVKKAASHFGTAFQIVDDIDDMEQDAMNQSKVNYACCFGKDAAIEAVKQEINGYRKAMKDLHLENTPVAEIIEVYSTL